MKNSKKLLLTILFAMLMLLVPISASAAKISKTSAKLLVGNTLQLKMSGNEGTEVKWSSTNKKIAKVNQEGIVTAVKKGKAVISAKVGNKKYNCKVTVYNPKLNKTSVKIRAGKKVTLKVSGTYGKSEWRSSDKSIATVSKKGVVTAKKAGKVTISVKTAGKTLKCEVTVTKKSSSSSSSSSDDSDGGSAWLSATGSCYHSYNSCGRMNPSKARKVSVSYAKSNGFKKCSNCW